MQNFSPYTTYGSLLAKKQGKGFSELEAKDILCQVIAELIRMHEQKQSHGSISLETIAYEEHRRQIVLLSGNGSNNPIYLAPEILLTRKATPTADIYALGVVMIALLTGSPPEDLKAPNNKWNWEERCIVSDRLTQILNMALSPALDLRYANAGQMLLAIQLPITAIEPLLEDHINPSHNPAILLPLPILPKPSQPSKISQATPSTPESTPEIDAPKQRSGENMGANNSNKMQSLKANLPNSPTYRRSKFSAKSSQAAFKNKGKSRIRMLLVIILGTGVIAGLGVIAYFFYTFFYTQIKLDETTKKNLVFSNTITALTTTSTNIAITHIYDEKNEKKANENAEKLIALAKTKYDNSGNLTEAKIILQAVPASAKIRKKVDFLLSKWQEDNTKNGNLIQKAEQAAKNGKWQLAIDTIKSISSTPYWQKRGQKIANEAKKKLVTPIIPPPQITSPPSQDITPPIADTYNPPPARYEAPAEPYTPPPARYEPPADTYTPPPVYDPPPANSTRQAPPPPPAN
ncbi:serine/threonine protein kinase [Pseudanabaena biceps]|nr:serine/threonine protein kinase [Pseudanabaena biceps]ELS33324.1 Serine/threonine protein kinase-related protein [Pseudanabaena biceps PCC 7429]